ncbi:MAG: TetR/AcrR family transcriptional regulator [Comamonadaceae bacterium]|nr:MAG: TetR/AcrR family transcriptional regulator [Comamonadaceae bacterium]
MVKKAPRRTAQRILETAVELFNRLGEPNVSTTAVAAELGISPGNLYYHYASKDEIVNQLYRAYRAELDELLHASADVHDLEDAWFFMHSLFELIWRHRFLYRDLNDLLSNNRLLETEFQQVLRHKADAIRSMLSGLEAGGQLDIDARELEPLSQSMVVVLTYWLNYEYVLDPRGAQEPAQAQLALLRGAHHTLHLVAPYLVAAQRGHLMTLSEAYGRNEEAMAA